jgi:hypothetical protein
MRSILTCDGCDRPLDGQRVSITTEATTEDGVNVEVTKRWLLCRSCAETVFDRIGEASPWVDDDFKTVILPDDQPVGQQAGGFTRGV